MKTNDSHRHPGSGSRSAASLMAQQRAKPAVQGAGPKSQGEAQGRAGAGQRARQPRRHHQGGRRSDHQVRRYRFQGDRAVLEAIAYQQKDDADEGPDLSANRCWTSIPRTYQATLMLGEIHRQPHARKRSGQGREADQGRQVLNDTIDRREDRRQAESAAHRPAMGRRQESVIARSAQRSRPGRADAQEVRRGHHRIQDRGRWRPAAGLPGRAWPRPTSRPARTTKPSPSATSCWPTRNLHPADQGRWPRT